MASKQSTVDLILARLADAGTVSAKKMFGEYGLYCSGKLVGLVCDDRLYLKATAGGRQVLGDALDEAAPYPGAKPHFRIPSPAPQDGAWLNALIAITAAELPVSATAGSVARRKGR